MTSGQYWAPAWTSSSVSGLKTGLKPRPAAMPMTTMARKKRMLVAISNWVTLRPAAAHAAVEKVVELALPAQPGASATGCY